MSRLLLGTNFTQERERGDVEAAAPEAVQSRAARPEASAHQRAVLRDRVVRGDDDGAVHGHRLLEDVQQDVNQIADGGGREAARGAREVERDGTQIPQVSQGDGEGHQGVRIRHLRGRGGEGRSRDERRDGRFGTVGPSIAKGREAPLTHLVEVS